ncbi:MAG: DEAD/DEAH box helicase, partial [Thermoanaerobaculia bacterium]
MPLDPLPVDPHLPELLAALEASGAAVLRAPTGSGKTTRVPPALLAGEAGAPGGGSSAPPGRVVVLEPRRIAARAAARRVASERGWRLGGRVGWHVRLDRRAGPDTEVLFVTQGLLVRSLQEDPFLEGAGAVVFDEFHERSLEADVALGMVQRLRREVRPDLRVLVMSATLD